MSEVETGEPTERAATSGGWAPEPVELEFETWEHLLTTLEPLAQVGWIYRGQANYEWPLLSTLARIIAEPPSFGIPTDRENGAIGYFKYLASGYLSRVPEEADLLGWLSLMQHYRAPTRLLDWTESPFVGLYFAFEDASVGSDAVLWLLQPHYCLRQHVGVAFPMAWDHLGTYGAPNPDGSEEPYFPALHRTFADLQNDRLRRAIRHNSTWPLPLRPTRPDARMAAQQAVFTAFGALMPPIDHLMVKELWGERVYEKGMPIAGTDATVDPLVYPNQVVRKIKLKREWRDRAMTSLRSMGITAASLFPGIDGVGMATAEQLRSKVQSLASRLEGLTNY